MILPDVNVLVYAHRKDAEQHSDYLNWVETLIGTDGYYGISDLVISGFIRIVTHPRVFKKPSSIADALLFANQLRDQPNSVSITPGVNHWKIFTSLCRDANVRGNLVPDAWHAALAIEHGCEWITTDRDFSRFPGLKWRHPLHG